MELLLKIFVSNEHTNDFINKNCRQIDLNLLKYLYNTVENLQKPIIKKYLGKYCRYNFTLLQYF